ncbi:hypothetical protein EJ03DRAFT_299861 [Teratosphaeria nubilosa]|uniref:Rhodopsin domain-containing protein n=1 Tax=Teratosphaeria nubilosa TaxID=161662 RepID=A0A6G1KZ17_9PEZI|nr:hypothetical protein EJ03DRAFT_299861 [Teratosphaeria nubilosa]
MTVPIVGRGPEIYGTFILFVVLTTITLCLRMYSRASLVKKVGWDDWLAAIAWLFFICHASSAITGVYHGTGQHPSTIKPADEYFVALKYWWICEPLYVISNMAIKASIGIMLLRLAVRPAYRFTIYAVLAVTLLYSAAFFFIFIFQCNPPEYFWTRYTGGFGNCVSTDVTVAAVYAYSVITCLGDWIFAVLPCFLLWNVPMGYRQKMFVILVLAMGAIASAATIARIPFIHTMKNQADFLYATADVAIWSCSETGLGITAACCATLKPLLRSVLPSTFASGSQPRLTAESKGATHQKENEGRFKWLNIDGERALGKGEVHQNAYEMSKGTRVSAETRRDSSVSSSSQTLVSSRVVNATLARDFVGDR